VVVGSSVGISMMVNITTQKKNFLNFIRKGRVVNEYGEQIDVEEFIEMSLNWGQPDGFGGR